LLAFALYRKKKDVATEMAEEIKRDVSSASILTLSKKLIPLGRWRTEKKKAAAASNTEPRFVYTAPSNNAKLKKSDIVFVIHPAMKGSDVPGSTPSSGVSTPSKTSAASNNSSNVNTKKNK
jgi:hypothetical protein